VRAHVPTYGETTTISDWSVSLAKLTGPITKLYWTDYGNYLISNGHFWVVYFDAKNTYNGTRTLDSTLDFTLYDDHGASYPNVGSGIYNTYEMGEYAQRQGRDGLEYGVTPRDIAHPLLVFDIATDSVPAFLEIRGAYGGDIVRYNLKKK
jgi:hypothetical protein